MQPEGEANTEDPVFDIVHNARINRASRSRKSSLSVLQRDRPLPKFKKLRKMTLNPQSIRYQQILQMEERQKEHKEPASQRGEIKEEELNIDDFLELGEPRNKFQHDPQDSLPTLQSKNGRRFLELAEELQGLQLIH